MHFTDVSQLCSAIKNIEMASVVAKILYKDFQISVVADAQNGFLTEK